MPILGDVPTANADTKSFGASAVTGSRHGCGREPDREHAILIVVLNLNGRCCRHDRACYFLHFHWVY